MQITQKLILIFLLSLVWIGVIFAQLVGPGPSNGNGITTTTCASCHTGIPVTSFPSLTGLTGVSSPWLPNETRTLTLTVPAGVRHGFQISAIANSNTQAGTLTATDTFDTQTFTTTGIQYVEHTSSGAVRTGSGNNVFTFDWTSPPSGTGTVRFHVAALQADGNGAISGDTTYLQTYTLFEAAPDTTAPTVSITAPNSLAFVSGTKVLKATAADAVGVVGVQFKLDGNNLGAEITTSPYSFSWDTTTATETAHTLTAVARDAAGNSTTTAGVPVTVDNTAPTVSLASPSPGALVGGFNVLLTATASDNVGVQDVRYERDGFDILGFVTLPHIPPYSADWDTTHFASNGVHILTAVARDAAGNTTTSAGVSITVDNAAPIVSITAPVNGSFVKGSVTISATATDNVGIVGVQFSWNSGNLGSEITSPPYSVIWDTTTAQSDTLTVTAKARDSVGNLTTSSVKVNVDNKAPIVSMASPANGSTVNGSAVTISATAFDIGGVVGVQFALDGANLGVEDTTSPYSILWDSTTALNGPHTLTATARDTAGNTAPATIQVTVATPLLGTRTMAVGGISGVSTPKNSAPIQLNLSSSYPADVTGTLRATVTPNVVTAPNPDSGIYDFVFVPSGATTINFTIPANTTAAVFANAPAQFQSGTIAAQVQFTVENLTVGGQPNVTALSAGTTSVQRLQPDIASVAVSVTGTQAFNVIVTGDSTPREITQAIFTFTGTTFTSVSVPVTLTQPFNQFYQSPASGPAGSVFKMAMPFTISSKVADLKTVTVTLSNSQGTSASGTATFP